MAAANSPTKKDDKDESLSFEIHYDKPPVSAKSQSAHSVFMATRDSQSSSASMYGFTAKVFPYSELGQYYHECNVLDTVYQNPYVLKAVAYDDEKRAIITPRYDADLFRVLDCSALLTPERVQRFMAEMADGLKYIHSKGIIHRDLKLANVFLRDGMRHCLIGDFGSAKLSTDSTATHMDQSLVMASPENLCYDDLTDKCDIWSLGVGFYQLLMGTTEFPFDAPPSTPCMARVMAVAQSMHAEFGTFIPQKRWVFESQSTKLGVKRNQIKTSPRALDGAYDLLCRMWELDPVKRISAADMLNHPYFQSKSPPVVVKPLCHATLL